MDTAADYFVVVVAEYCENSEGEEECIWESSVVEGQAEEEEDAHVS